MKKVLTRILAEKTILILVASLMFLCLGGIRGIAADKNKIRPPFALIPKATEKPFMAPSLAMSGGWLQGAAFAGMTDLYSKSCLTWPDAGWFLTYDDKFLYVACLVRTPNKYTRFKGDCKDNDDVRILKDDHLEFQISFEDRAAAPAQPFYKVMVNPLGAVNATIYNWQPGQHKQGWAQTVKAEVCQQPYMDSYWWSTKIAIPLEELGVKSLDGKKALVQLVFSSGFQYYLGWVGAPWMDWNKFAEVEFDPKAPGYSINGTYPRLINPVGGYSIGGFFTPKISSDTEEKLVFSVANRANGKTLYQEKLTTKGVKGGARGHYGFTKGMKVAEKGNIFTVECYHQDPQGKETLLYRHDVPFVKPNDIFATTQKNWIKNHVVSGDAAATVDFSYFPYYHKLHFNLDTKIYLEGVVPDQLEKAKQIVEADSFRASVLENDNKISETITGPISKSIAEGEITFKQPLADGNYKLQVEVLNHGKVVDTLKRDFVREHFPWEHNQIGMGKVVIPPYTPIEKQNNTLKVWGREYRISPTGFFSSIKATGHELLDGDITLISIQDGKKFKLEAEGKPAIEMVKGEKFPADFIKYWYQASCPKASLEQTDGYQAKLTAKSTLGKIKVDVKATMEYEGWYQVTLDLKPEEKVKVDSLDLLIPFSNLPYPLMRFEREYSLIGLGAIPKGEGVLFETTKLPRCTGITGTMPPFIYIGNFSRGLWWMADSDQGWMVDDSKPVAQLERHKGKLYLRIRFVNTPSVMDKERKIRFAMQAVPMKPKPMQYRKIAWKYPEGQFAHDTSGFRYYGSGVDGFTLYNDKDYEGLKYFYYDMDLKKQLKPMPGCAGNWWGMSWLLPSRKGHPLVEYGSTWMASAGMKEFPTFMGEWCYTNDYGKYATEAKFKGRMNYGRTYTWNTDLELTPIMTTANKSFRDCLIWHMTRIAKNSDINGSFHDNYSSTLRYAFLPGKVRSDATGDAYRRDNGKLQGVSAPFRRHYFLKRMATALWLLGRPSFQLVAWEPDISFAEASWFVEGPWYHESADKDFIEKGMTPELFQATTCKPGQIGYLDSHFAPIIKDGKKVGHNERAVRLALGYVLLNDLGGCYNLLTYSKGLLKKLEETVKFFDGAIFRPYWEATDWITQKPKGLLISSYVHPEKQNAVLVIVNPTEQSVELSLGLDSQLLLGRQSLKKAVNFETEQELKLTEGKISGLNLKRHQLIILLVE